MEVQRASFSKAPPVGTDAKKTQTLLDKVPALGKLPTNQFIENLIGTEEDRRNSNQPESHDAKHTVSGRRSHCRANSSTSVKQTSPKNSARQSRSGSKSHSRKSSSIATDRDEVETVLDLSDKPFVFDVTGQKTYENACRRYNTCVSQAFHRKLPASSVIDMRHYGAGPSGAKAIAIPMVNNTRVTTLNLRANDLGPDGISYVCKMMAENLSITELDLSENNLRTHGAKQVAEMLKCNHNLKTLHLANNNFTDGDASILADTIEEHPILQNIDLSNNSFGEQAGCVFRKMISENGTLQEVDLSWNNIRMKGAVDLARAVKENIGLKVLRVAWNGFGNVGAIEMGHALKVNGTLTELDMTCNRISAEGLTGLLRYIGDNDDLKTLKVGRNPVTEDGAMVAMEIFRKLDTLALQLLDLGEVTLGPRFKEKLEEVQEKHTGFTCVHGYTDSYGKRKLKKYDVVEEALNAMKSYLDAHNLNIAELFSQIDTDGSMSVSYDEFREGIKTAKIPLTKEQIEQLIKALDEDGDGEIDFSEMVIGAESYEAGSNP